MDQLISNGNLDIFIKLFVAVVLGMIIGTERVIAHKTVGMRTYALVALGAALFVSISEMMALTYFGGGDLNPAQIPAAIVTGIGFLGAGLMIFKDNKIAGVTTASSIWLVAGIGIACGFGMFSLALMATGLTLFVFIVLWFVEEKIKNLPSVKSSNTNTDI